MDLLRRRPRVAADLGTGFALTEAPALQTAIVEAMHAVERASGGPVPAELVFEPGRGDRVAVVWRNAVVGFVPRAQEGALSALLGTLGRARLVGPGVVHRSTDPDGLWRVWAGPVPARGFPPVAHDEDRLKPPGRRVLGIPLPPPDEP